jgi:hypothetical protein
MATTPGAANATPSPALRTSVSGTDIVVKIGQAGFAVAEIERIAAATQQTRAQHRRGQDTTR